MGDGDRLEPAQFLDGLDGRVIEQADAVPEDVSFGRLNEQRALSDSEGGLRPDTYKARFLNLDAVTVFVA